MGVEEGTGQCLSHCKRAAEVLWSTCAPWWKVALWGEGDLTTLDARWFRESYWICVSNSVSCREEVFSVRQGSSCNNFWSKEVPSIPLWSRVWIKDRPQAVNIFFQWEGYWNFGLRSSSEVGPSIGSILLLNSVLWRGRQSHNRCHEQINHWDYTTGSSYS